MRDLRDTTLRRIKEIRKQRGMTQADLAERLNQLGAYTNRSTVGKVETGDRELTLREAFAYAWALHVAPVHLFAPDDDEPIRIGPEEVERLSATPREVRAWIRGDHPLMSAEREYFLTVPESEHDDGMRKLLAWRERAPISVRTSDKPDEGDR